MLPVQSNIPLSVQAPNILNPQQLQQGNLNLQQMANATAIQQQTQQENALKLQNQQKDAEDQSIFQQAIKNNTSTPTGPDGKPGTPVLDWDAALAEGQKNGMLMKNVQAFQNEHLNALKAAAELPKIQLENVSNTNAAIGRELAYIKTLPVADRPAAAATSHQSLNDQGIIKADDPRYQLPSDLGDPSLDAMIARSGYTGVVADNALKAAQAKEAGAKYTQAERSIATQEYRAIPPDPTTGIRNQAAVDALRAKYKGVQFPDPAAGSAGEDAFISASVDPKELPDYLLKTAQARAYAQMTPSDWHKQVDAVLPPSGDSAQLNTTTKADIDNAVNMKQSGTAIEAKIDKAVQQLNEQRKSVAVAKNTVPFKIDVGAGIANATAGVKSRQAAQQDYVGAMKDYEQ